MENKYLWEILVPTVMDRENREGKLLKDRPIKIKHHKVWDKKVQDIAGGLTIMRPAKGYWESPSKELFVERMIPVRIFCTEDEINSISDFTASHYNQEAIMFYKVSEKVTIKYYGDK